MLMTKRNEANCVNSDVNRRIVLHEFGIELNNTKHGNSRMRLRMKDTIFEFSGDTNIIIALAVVLAVVLAAAVVLAVSV